MLEPFFCFPPCCLCCQQAAAKDAPRWLHQLLRGAVQTAREQLRSDSSTGSTIGVSALHRCRLHLLAKQTPLHLIHTAVYQYCAVQCSCLYTAAVQYKGVTNFSPALQGQPTSQNLVVPVILVHAALITNQISQNPKPFFILIQQI